jgi:hypothetical protein
LEITFIELQWKRREREREREKKSKADVLVCKGRNHQHQVLSLPSWMLNSVLPSKAG